MDRLHAHPLPVAGSFSLFELQEREEDDHVNTSINISNQFTCIGPDSSNPLFIRMKDGHSTRVEFNTASQYITRFEDF